uniref:MAK10-like protein n=1 Tax=Tanacetum cinerariifolium TaxID=118510 RepID=A0A6L2LTQ0_TANCI|nr:MAK10-like protein [Tanacetum cinerariifolium]
MFQQQYGESLYEAWTCFKDLLQKVPHHDINLWLQVQILYNHVNQATRNAINHSAGGKLRDKSFEESWELIKELTLYDNESWNDPKDFAKLVKEISLPQDVLSTSDRRLVKLEKQVQRLMEAHLAPKPSVKVNEIVSSNEICGGPYDTQYYLKNLEQDFADYVSSRTDEAGGAAKLRRMGQEKVHNGCDIDTSRDRNHESVEDVERIKQFFNVPDETDEVIQPLIPQPIHITLPIDDYVAPDTKSILNELLEDKILNVTLVDKEADFNHTKDIEELEKFLANEPQSHVTDIHVHSVIAKPEPFIHT